MAVEIAELLAQPLIALCAANGEAGLSGKHDEIDAARTAAMSKYPDGLLLVGAQARMQITVCGCRHELASHAVAIAWCTGAR